MDVKILAVVIVYLLCSTMMTMAIDESDCDCTPPSYPPYERPSPPPHRGTPPKVSPPVKPPPVFSPPVIRPPPVVLPPIVRPPPVVLPPIIMPPVIMPPVIMPPPVILPPITNPPRISPPVIPPPVIPPPSSGYPPYTPPPSGGGGGPPGGGTPTPSPKTNPTCPIDALKLGLCLDVLGGLIHVGIGNPTENVCCPVLQGLLELEAAICLCTTIRLKVLNLNIFLPIALQVLATCGKNPPPGFICPPLP